MGQLKNTTIVIFGGVGDLTKRKLIPSLYLLFRSNKLPESFAILGLARRDYNDEAYRTIVADKLKEFVANSEYNQDTVNAFIEHIYFHSMELNVREDFQGLKEHLEKLDKKINNPGNYIFYLATPPSLYGEIPQHLAAMGLNEEKEDAFRRIIIEKPYGYNLKTAQALNKIYETHFEEHQLYRIDHYLGKETVQNIMALRFANGIFEPLWNRNYIDRIEVTAVESLGIGKRGGFYDQTGALRDMVQNHLIQLVALTAMEPPTKFNADSFRNEVLKVYQSLQPLSEEDIKKSVIRGQYIESKHSNKEVRDYRHEENVDPNSRTETFLAMRLYIANWRWDGVPFYIRTGKQMPTKVSEIVVHFKKTPHQIFNCGENCTQPNQLIIRLQPNEGIALKFSMKVPGSGFEMKQVSMDFTYDRLGGVPTGDAYARLLEDCLTGDPTLFTRSDAVEASWKFFDPILDAWKENQTIPLYGYPAGTWGPLETKSIMLNNQEWTNPCKNLTNTDLYCEL